MEFCSKCNSLMIPKKENDKVFLVCRNCGTKKKSKSSQGIRLKEKVKKDPMEDVVVADKEVTALPKTKKICPKCGNNEAYWWTQQTRSGDEPPTRFYQCTNCEHNWREYG